MRFSFSTAATILFGNGIAKTIPERAAALGSRACLVTGGHPERLAWLTGELNRLGLRPVTVPIPGEPDTDSIASAARIVREAGCDVVVAVGGGSVLDAGKALAALLANRRELMDYLEVVGKGLPLTERPAPCIAAPTTAGTGAEVTANAVLRSPEHGIKVSMRSPAMLPDLAVIDPELALSAPPEVTASTGMDALTQLLEAFVSGQATPMTDALCRDGLPRAARALWAAYADGANIKARGNMALASLYSGIALANAKLGAAHGFAGPLGGGFDAPHGAICAALLPHVVLVNVDALRERAPASPALDKYAEAARLLTGDPAATIQDGADWLSALCADLGIPGLAALGVVPDDFPALAANAARTSSMKGNPIELTPDELLSILRRAL